MKRPSILNGIVVAFILTVMIIPCAMILAVFLHPVSAAKAEIGILASIYGFYLLSREKHRVGRCSLGLGFLSILGMGMVLALSFFEYLLLSLGLIWVVRSLLNHRSIVSALLDGALVVLGLGSGMWAFFISGSFLSAVWCFFLTQALFALIPRKIGGRSVEACSIFVQDRVSEDKFSRAYTVAEKAIINIARS